MWSDGRGRGETRISPSASDRQEKERKQEKGTAVEKINIAGGIMERGTLGDRCRAAETQRKLKGLTEEKIFGLARRARLLRSY